MTGGFNWLFKLQYHLLYLTLEFVNESDLWHSNKQFLYCSQISLAVRLSIVVK